jgi:hypothetical protein
LAGALSLSAVAAGDLRRSNPATVQKNISRLRRFATGLIQAKSNDSVSATIDKLARKVRLVFDYLRMTANSNPRVGQTAPVG